MLKRYFLLPLSLLLMGKMCEVDVTDRDIADTMTELNSAWKKGYNKTLADVGTRHYGVIRSKAFSRMRKTLEILGFTFVLTEGDYYLSISTPASLMFTNQEWERVRSVDEPGMREIVSKRFPIKANFAKLEPEGLLIEGKVTLVDAGDGVDISMTFRLHEIKPRPPESILPRREYPPPFAARTGLEKIWRQFEKLGQSG